MLPQKAHFFKADPPIGLCVQKGARTGADPASAMLMLLYNLKDFLPIFGPNRPSGLGIILIRKPGSNQGKRSILHGVHMKAGTFPDWQICLASPLPPQ
jgi:hypothetical protein